jgi:hydroxyacylglutathione hydrolase
VRKATEYSASHLEGAKNIAHTRLRERLDEISAGTQWVVHCQTGVRAAGACAFLEREGRDVICVADGFENAPETLLSRQGEAA